MPWRAASTFSASRLWSSSPRKSTRCGRWPTSWPKQVIQAGFQRRYSKFYQIAKVMVSKGLIGNVTHIAAQWHRNPGGASRRTPPASGTVTG